MATLELKLDGKDISIPFPVDSIAGYRQATEVLKKYRKVAKAGEIIKGGVSEDQSFEILDQSVELMESFKEAVHLAIGDAEYDTHLKDVADDFPFTVWPAILSEIIGKYTEYFAKVTGTEGEL
jgi:hypothetical protein